MRPRGARQRDAGGLVAWLQKRSLQLQGFAKTDRLQELALRRRHGGRVSGLLPPFLQGRKCKCQR